MDHDNNFDIIGDYSANLINGIEADMQERENHEIDRIIRLEKETRFNHRVALGSLIVGIATLFVAIATLIVTIA